MKIIINIGLLAVSLSLAACGNAETTNNSGPAALGPQKTAETHSANGTVNKVIVGQVTIAHGPIETLQWPAMTMPFSAPNASLLDGIKVGDRVAFSFVKSGEGYALITISKK